MQRFFKNHEGSDRGKQVKTITIFSDIHTSQGSYVSRNRLRELAKEGKIIFLDEALDLASPRAGAYHLPLDNGHIKSFGSTVKQIITLDELFNNITIDEFITARIDFLKKEINKASIMMIKCFVYNFNNIYFECNNNIEIQVLLKENISKSGIVFVDDYLAKLHAKIQLLIEKTLKFSFIKTTVATDENIKLFSDIVTDLFQLKNDLICYNLAYSKAMTVYLTNIYPEYQSYFEKFNMVLTRDLHPNYFCIFLRNLFMAKNIDTAMHEFNKDLVVMVGRNHTINDEKRCMQSLQFLLKDTFSVDESQIRLIEISDLEFDIDANLGLKSIAVETLVPPI